ncbi:hypothetical protein ACIRYZ_44115 [Kitasatospora sp. NPDC101155]|uniref:hypothetical protein n=1 Tax=Kitasatospora sp. NPDC101155 TaxID=3364097 RepID=UPI00381B52E8
MHAELRAQGREAGRKRTRPGTKPLAPEQQAAKAERDHQRLLRRLEAVEDGSAAYWSPRPYPFAGVSAGNYHLALPVVATTLQLLDAHGADAAVWRRFGREGWHTLTAALDNPDGDRLLAIERRTAAAARRAREQAEREASRPACTRCEAKLTDAEWERARWGERLCTPCQKEESDRKRAQLAAAEAEAAAAEAAKAKNARPWWRRS